MTNKPKRKGTDAEVALLAWLHDQGYHDARRNPPAGTKDVGDLTVTTDMYDWWADDHLKDIEVVIEVKNRADIATAIREGLDELDTEMDNAGTEHGVLVLKPRGVGLSRPGEWYAVRRVKNDPEIGA